MSLFLEHPFHAAGFGFALVVTFVCILLVQDYENNEPKE